MLEALAEGAAHHPDGTLAQITLTFRATAVPALGYRRYLLRAREAGAAGWIDDEGTTIENGAFRVTADPARGGTLVITDKLAGRDVLRGPGNELVLQEEYDKHPRWGEGPWHLSPKGPGHGSASSAAAVRAQYCPVGRRLVATFTLGDLEIRQETLLWHGSDRVEFRTHVAGSVGKDQLLRVRFPADVPGGLPVYQTATAVIGRPFGAPEADTATHWWTLDNPANQWFGLGSVARVALGQAAAAIGVAEVITPDIMPERARRTRPRPPCLPRRGRRHGDLFPGRRAALRVGGRRLQPAGLPDRARRSGPERVHRGGARGMRPGRGQAAGRAAGGRRRGAAVGAGRRGRGRRRSRRAPTCGDRATCRC